VPPDPEGLPPDPEVLPLDPAIKVIYGLWQAVVVMVVVMVYGGGHGGDVGPNCVPLCPQSPKTAVLVIQAMELHRTLRPSGSCVAGLCNKEKKNRKKRASRRTFADTAMQISTIEPGDESTAEDF